jgi:hypothetical protein
MRNPSAYVVVFATIASLAAAFFLLGPKPVEADQNKTTEQAAAAVGATVSPTAPRLRVEPKGYRPE